MRVKLRRNERGSIIILSTFMLPILLAFIGLAVDGGLLFEIKRQMQTSADSAAVAGAAAKRSGADADDITEAARTDAALNGFQHAAAEVTVTVNNPPTSGPYNGTDGYVEVVINKVMPTYFIRVLSMMLPGDFTTATVAARAVAGLEGQNCIYALNPTANAGLKLAGTPNLNAPDCSVYVGSNSGSAMHLEGQASINVAAINIVGEYNCQGQSCGNITPEPNTGSASEPDPLASLPVPSPSGPCLPSPGSGGGPAVLSPGRYCNGINIEGIPSATFSPGVYYVENGFRITSTPVVSGNGVVFYIATGQLRIDGGANVNFTAPTSGTYKGIIFFQARNNTSEVILTGGSAMQLNGAIYAFGAALDYSGGNCTGSPPKTMLVTDTIEFVGHSCISRPDDLPSSAGKVVLAE
jgi:Flp pilus assembly protein TadG